MICTDCRSAHLCDRCYLGKDLVEQEAQVGNGTGGVGEREGAAKPFEHMKEIVARDAVTLGELETLLARVQVGFSLKAGFVADMEERELTFIKAGVLGSCFRFNMNGHFVSLAQVRAMVTEMEAANDPDEYYDSLRCLRESWRIGEDKLRGLNETIAAAEDKISTLESHLEIMDAAINSDD
ncbi:hypothetical protein Tco_1273615 [Tanacetum coccineum]